MIVEGPRRIPSPEWAVYAFIAGLYGAIGNTEGMEGNLLYMLGEVVTGQFGGRA